MDQAEGRLYFIELNGSRIKQMFVSLRRPRQYSSVGFRSMHSAFTRRWILCL